MFCHNLKMSDNDGSENHAVQQLLTLIAGAGGEDALGSSRRKVKFRRSRERGGSLSSDSDPYSSSVSDSSEDGTVGSGSSDGEEDVSSDGTISPRRERKASAGDARAAAEYVVEKLGYFISQLTRERELLCAAFAEK